MIEFFSCPHNVLRTSTRMLLAGLAILLVGVVGAYGMEGQLSIPALVTAHAGVIIGPTLVKIGYVMRLLAHHYLRKQGWEANCASA